MRVFPNGDELISHIYVQISDRDRSEMHDVKVVDQLWVRTVNREQLFVGRQ